MPSQMNDPYHPPKEMREPIAMGELADEIYHFAFWKLLPAMKTTNAEKLEKAVADMRVIPGVAGIYFGPGISAPMLDADEIDYAMLEVFTFMDAARSYLPHPVHRATIDISRDITREGGAIYFTPLKIFASTSAPAAAACIQSAMIWLSETDNRQNTQSLIDVVSNVRDIPGLIDIKFGPRAPTNWIGPDDTFDCAVNLSFDSCENAASAVSLQPYKNLCNAIGRVGKKHQWYSFISDMK